MMDIEIKKILDNYSKDDVKLPLITEGNACYDFYAPRNSSSIPVNTASRFRRGWHLKSRKAIV